MVFPTHPKEGDMKVGDHVWADFGSGKTLAHIVQGAHENPEGDTKWGVQAPDGSVRSLAHREPADVDAAGTGLTFWRL